ncbi:hypothetical protein O6H91_07G123400 [Diphasiastrum complanatum]|uniref:Uncharacterized protein n=1 Tax=Diphasiastrum complanatum TaxID=34168 RepID=A0ACC2D9V0_DIPCM|nr:hypothetical protein O6H91_07G123400 [Diphasiastrum complanatum]
MRKSGRPKRRARIAWDEENLEYLEATKSPKQKINEPKTPYRPPEEDDGVISPFPDENTTNVDAVAHAEAIRHALSDVASTSNGRRRQRGGGWTSSEDEAEEIEPSTTETAGVNGSSLTFQEHRRKHYDEFRKVKMLLSQGSQLDDEDDIQEDDRGKKSAVCSKPIQDQECCLAGGVCAIELQDDTKWSEKM